MATASAFPIVEVSVVLIERAELLLVEFNPKGWDFTLPMARRRRRKKGTELESAAEAALRAATCALGRPLSPAQFPRKVTLLSPYARLRSGRDGQTRDYRYSVFAKRVETATPRHALGWHTLWMSPANLLTHAPVSETVRHLLPLLPEDYYAE